MGIAGDGGRRLSWAVASQDGEVGSLGGDGKEEDQERGSEYGEEGRSKLGLHLGHGMIGEREIEDEECERMKEEQKFCNLYLQSNSATKRVAPTAGNKHDDELGQERQSQSG